MQQYSFPEQNAITFERAFKECYLPAWQNQLSTEPTPLLSKIKTISGAGKKIVATAPIGLSGGFGFSEEGQQAPMAGGVVYERFEETPNDMYVSINISDKVMKLSASDKNAMVNALDGEVKASYVAAKWNVGRSLFGNGTGILSKVSAGTGLVVDVEDTKLLKEGLIVDFYPTGSVKESVPAVAGRRIVSVDRRNNRISISGAPVTVPEGFVTVQNSYCREITGVGAIFDDSIDTLYGLKKSENPWMYPVVRTCANSLDDSKITAAIRECERYKGGIIDVLLCGDMAFDYYVDYLRTNNIRNEKADLTVEGGFKAIAFVVGNRVVEVLNESFVPDNDIWGFPSSSLELHLCASGQWEFVQKGGPAFSLMPGTAVFNALLALYGNLICTQPGACLRLTDCA